MSKSVKSKTAGQIPRAYRQNFRIVIGRS
jgi:hypothetical protein